MYQAITIWKRCDGMAICYRCLQNVESGKFTVQSADEYHLPVSAEWKTKMDLQFVELLIEDAPEARVGRSFDTIAEAIEHHDKTFHDFEDLGDETPPGG